MANEFTRYQAAVLYDFHHSMQAGSPTWPVRELVVDTDTGTLGLCSCTRDGVVTLLAQAGTVGSPLAQLWLERLAADCGAPSRRWRNGSSLLRPSRRCGTITAPAASLTRRHLP